MKKHFRLILITLLAAVMAVTLSACGDGNEPPSAKPVEWKEYLDEAAERIADNVGLTGGFFGLELKAEFEAAERKNVFYFGLNYNVNDLDDGVLFAELTADGKSALSLAADNASAYADVADNEYIGNAKVKLTDVNFFNILGTYFNDDGLENVKDGLKRILVNVGGALFSEVNVSADKNTYAFSVSDKLWESGSLQNFIELFSNINPMLCKLIFNIFDVSTYEELAAILPRFGGVVKVLFDGDKFVGVETEELTLDGEGAAEFKMTVTAGGEPVEGLAGKLPSADSGYKVTKTGALTLGGSLGLFTSAYNKRAAEYNFDFVGNLDILNLSLVGGDFSKLPGDNFFHLRINHVCGADCTEFCRDKYAENKGAVLDVAFSPKDFGSNNIYIVFAFKSMMSDRLTKFLLGETYGSEKPYPDYVSMPDYTCLTIPAQNTGEGGAIYKLLVSLYVNNLFETGESEMPLAEVYDAFGDDNAVASLLKTFMKSDEFDNDLIKFDVTKSLFGQADDYDVFKEAMVFSDETSGIKNFENGSVNLADDIALNWIFEADALTTDGRLTNIYDVYGNLLHGGVAGTNVYVPMSADEAAHLAGNYIKYSYSDYNNSYTDVNGNPYRGFAEIVGVEGMNLHSSEVQDVKLTVKYPTFFDNKYVSKLFRGYGDYFTVKVDAEIKLCGLKTEGFIFKGASEETEFRVRSGLNKLPEFMTADVTMLYTNGAEKTLQLNGQSSAVYEKSYLGILPSSYYIVAWNDVRVDFNVAGRTISKYYNIKKPDSHRFEIKEGEVPELTTGKKIFISQIANKTKLCVKYADEDEEIDVMLLLSDFYLNGMPLNKSSSDWSIEPLIFSDSYSFTFNKSNDYSAVIKKQDVASAPFTLRVMSKHSGKPAYEFVKTDNAAHYFVGANSRFGANLINSKHGETDNTLRDFSVTVKKGRVSVPTGVISYDEDLPAEDFLVKVGSVTGNGGLKYDVPSTIVKAKNVSVTGQFSEPGYYRIRLYMSGDGSTASCVWEVYVENQP